MTRAAERKRSKRGEASAQQDKVTMYCYQIKGKMDSDEHCYPAFLSGNLEQATEESIREVIAVNCEEPVENIVLVGGDRIKKFQQRYKDGWDLLLNRPVAEAV